MSITENQLNYIRILSSYNFTHDEDKQDIKNFLNARAKSKLRQLNKNEASDLIQLLLKRPTGYLLPCDIVIVLDKKEVNSFHVLGNIEACNHYCPDDKYIGDCEKYKAYQESLDEYSSENIEQKIEVDYSNKRIIKIKKEEHEPSNLSNRERYELIVDDFVKSDSRVLFIKNEECRTDLSKHYFLYWIKQKYNIDEFEIFIKYNRCYIKKI